MLKYLYFFTLFVSIFQSASAQNHNIKGRVIDLSNRPIVAADIFLTNGDIRKSGQSDSLGKFAIIAPGARYRIEIRHAGYEEYKDTILVDGGVALPDIILNEKAKELAEATIISKIIGVIQKDDTLEFNSGAYKVNADADAADLARKIPGIQLEGKNVTAHGETVLKVLVDGKPFFGDDPYATLKNIPADIIGKVQVYNEKTELDKLTGFTEGATTKTINIITKPGKNKGVFGKVYGGMGGNAQQGTKQDVRYGSGLALNQFDGSRRISATLQANNINEQNFTDQSTTANTGGGTTATRAAGINYSDKWHNTTDVTASYFFTNTDNRILRDIRRTYFTPTAAGQVYSEAAPSANETNGHRVNMRINYAADSSNRLLWVPQMTINTGNANTNKEGSTTAATTLLNQTMNSSNSNNLSYALTSNLLYSHKFRKRGRTATASINASKNKNDNTTLLRAENIYYSSAHTNDTMNQQSLQQQQSWNVAADLAYTEPINKHGLLKLQYNFSYLPTEAHKNTYDYSAANSEYEVLNPQLSNVFTGGNMVHKAGSSYMLQLSNASLSAGLNYQRTVLNNTQELPRAYTIDHHFENILPVATLNYKLSKAENLQCQYTTSTQAPSATQLQAVVNNNDPLHLYTGDPELKQSYTHNISVRYSGSRHANSLSMSLTGRLTDHYITQTSIIPVSDTLVRGIFVPKGSQLSIPVNLDGYRSATANLSYGMPLHAIKCNFNISVNGGISSIPTQTNNYIFYRQNNNAGLNLSINSNISENIDFNASSATTLTSIMPATNQPGYNYVNQLLKATLNCTLPFDIVLSSATTWQINTGLSAGYNQNYVLWNISAGKKFLSKKLDVRLTAFDVLNNNNNVQRTITETYIQDTHTNILQRYFMLVATYKINKTGI